MPYVGVTMTVNATTNRSPPRNKSRYTGIPSPHAWIRPDQVSSPTSRCEGPNIHLDSQDVKAGWRWTPLVGGQRPVRTTPQIGGQWRMSVLELTGRGDRP